VSLATSRDPGRRCSSSPKAHAPVRSRRPPSSPPRPRGPVVDPRPLAIDLNPPKALRMGGLPKNDGSLALPLHPRFANVSKALGGRAMPDPPARSARLVGSRISRNRGVMETSGIWNLTQANRGGMSRHEITRGADPASTRPSQGPLIPKGEGRTAHSIDFTPHPDRKPSVGKAPNSGRHQQTSNHQRPPGGAFARKKGATSRPFPADNRHKSHQKDARTQLIPTLRRQL
jgi:hypothetical protein